MNNGKKIMVGINPPKKPIRIMIYQKLFVVLLFITITIGFNTFSHQAVIKPFHEGKELKIISALCSLDPVLASTASAGAGFLVDIGWDGKFVKICKASDSPPVCGFSIRRCAFLKAIEAIVGAGATKIEIGHFDGYYEYSDATAGQDILFLAKETRKMLPNRDTYCLIATIPEFLRLTEKVELGRKLADCNVDILHAEGYDDYVDASLKQWKLSQAEYVRAVPALNLQHALKLALPNFDHKCIISTLHHPRKETMFQKYYRKEK
jgi:hypothetical protein